MPVELLPDAWERFEQAVKVVAESPPQHRTSKANPVAPDEIVEIVIPKGVSIDLSGLSVVAPGADGSAYRWGRSRRPPHKTGNRRRVLCRDRETLLSLVAGQES
jgi:hypothetical protein